jgi:hypothetical protein
MRHQTKKRAIRTFTLTQKEKNNEAQRTEQRNEHHF